MGGQTLARENILAAIERVSSRCLRLLTEKLPIRHINAVDPRESRPGVEIYCESKRLSLLNLNSSVP
eukprot:5838174-Lingulodinium_polyedra.AAC.1